MRTVVWMAALLLMLPAGAMAQEMMMQQEAEQDQAESSAAAQAGPTAMEVKSDWNDFLHYTMIGRFDLAQGFGQKLLDSNPDPLLLLELSEANPNGYKILLRMQAESDQLRDVATSILKIIEEGRYMRRTDPQIIIAEIERLNTTIRGKIAAQERLKNAGEYAIPFMLDVLSNPDLRDQYANIIETLPMIGRPAIRPLITALQMNQVAVKIEIVNALGKIGYFQSLPYLKYVVEFTDSAELRNAAQAAINEIDSSTGQLPAAELFYMLAEKYYNGDQSVAPSAEFSFANLWFYDTDKQMLVRLEVDPAYFNELMAMRNCEWALKADPAIGKAIGLWIASFFRAESCSITMPDYFGEGHADAMTYAVTAGPEYLMLALDRALNDQNAYVALHVVEALAVNAGSKALLTRVGTEMPLAKALTFKDRKVRYSAAIALGQANPTESFMGIEYVVPLLAEALLKAGAEEMTPASSGQEDAGTAEQYSIRALRVLHSLAVQNNRVVNLPLARQALIQTTQDGPDDMKILAGQTLAHLPSPEAQRAVADVAMNDQNSMTVRIEAFASLANSAKMNANLLLTDQIEAMYGLIQSRDADPQLREAAAGAYGTLNLPSQRVKDLILDQAKS